MKTRIRTFALHIVEATILRLQFLAFCIQVGNPAKITYNEWKNTQSVME